MEFLQKSINENSEKSKNDLKQVKNAEKEENEK